MESVMDRVQFAMFIWSDNVMEKTQSFVYMLEGHR